MMTWMFYPARTPFYHASYRRPFYKEKSTSKKEKEIIIVAVPRFESETHIFIHPGIKELGVVLS